MKTSELLNQHVVVSAFLALLAGSVAYYPFSGEHPLLFFSFSLIIRAFVLFLVTVLPLIALEALFSYLHERGGYEIGLPVKWLSSLLLSFLTALIFGFTSSAAYGDLLLFLEKGYDLYVPALVAGLVFRLFRHRRIRLG